jgi:hypothetical protein
MQMREREERENYICSSHLGLIRWRTGTPQEIETIRDEPSDRKHVFLPQELDHCESPRSKEMIVTTADMFQGRASEHQVSFIPNLP